MRDLLVIAGMAALLSAPADAAAQPRQPADEAVALGGAAGVFFPAEDGMDAAPYLEGQFQYQFTPRIGVRFSLGWTDPDFSREEGDSVRQFRIGGDVLYNWEQGAWHPYVGAGLGTHLLQPKDNGDSLGDGESKFGGAALGGIEYFFTRDATITGEVRYQFVDDIDGVSPSGIVLAAGIKKYF
jgi:opacity protein-like surface antigen